jgi:O-antigen/teichoic acid export membrane protein
VTTVLESPPARRTGGAGWLLIATTGAGIVNYGYALVLTHGLTPGEYAAFAAGQALLLVRATVSGAGIPWILARELGRAPHDVDRRAVVVTFAFWTNLVVGVLLTALVAGGVLLFGSVRDAAVVAAASMVMSIGSTGMGFLQGIGRMDLIAVLFTGEVLVKAAAGLGLVFVAGLGATGALAGFVAGSLVLLAPLPMFRRLIRPPAWRSTEASLLRAAVRQTHLQANVAVAAAGDTVLIAVLGLGAGGGGPYQAASALGRVPLFASNAVATAAFPQLARAGSAVRKAAALRSYLLVGVLMTGALVTLPDGLRSALFPETFDAVGRWLPYAAVLGLAVGLLNLCVMFLQADDWHGGTAAYLTGVVVAYLGLIAAAGVIAGVAGLAVGAAAASLLAVVALAVLPSVRPAARLLLTSRRTLRDTGGLLVLIGALAVVGNPVLWLVLAVVAGFVVLAAGFPELSPIRRRS